MNQEKTSFSTREVNRREKRREALLDNMRRQKSELVQEMKKLLENKNELVELVRRKNDEIEKMSEDLYDA